jgi:hypothetical protein
MVTNDSVALPRPLATGELRSPRDLPYYDVAWAKALSLESMNFVEEERLETPGVTVIRGRWVAFSQRFVANDGPLNDPRTYVTVPWRQRGALCLPRSPANEASASRGQGVTYNVHDASNQQLFADWCVGIAAAFQIPVLIHGWEPDVVAPLGSSYHAAQFPMMERLLARRIERLSDLPLDGSFMMNGNPLVKGDLVAITALQRLVEREGHRPIEEVGALGISKEGGAHWVLGAIDDRVAVLAPGGAYAEDTQAILERYRADWNCELPAELQDFHSVWKLFDWALRTEAGRLVDRLGSPSHWSSEIHARHVLISGDLGRATTNADGSVSRQHDWPWPVLAENRFLSTLAHPSWRYVRVPDGSGVSLDDRAGEMGRSLLPQVADALVEGSTTPTNPVVNAVATARVVTITAQAQLDARWPVEAFVIYAMESDRRLRRATGAPGVPALWHAVPMQRLGSSFIATLPQVPVGRGLTFEVLVRQKVTRGPVSYYRSASSLPREMFALPEARCALPAWNEP